MNIKELTCFGTGGGGNPALVVEDGPRGDQEHARHALTCVFLDAPGAPGLAATLDFVYPHMRSPLCLHATLAAAQVLFARHGDAAPLQVATAMRGQRLVLEREGEPVFVQLARQDVPQKQGLAEGDPDRGREDAFPGHRPRSHSRAARTT